MNTTIKNVYHAIAMWALRTFDTVDAPTMIWSGGWILDGLGAIVMNWRTGYWVAMAIGDEIEMMVMNYIRECHNRKCVPYNCRMSFTHL